MRLVTLVFVLVIASILIIVFIAKDKNTNVKNKINPIATTTTLKTITEEKPAIPETDIIRPYNFINLEKIGKECLKLLNNGEYSNLIELLDNNKCTNSELEDAEKLIVKAIAYRNLQNNSKEAETLIKIIKKYKSDQIVSNNEELLFCTLIEKSGQNNKYELVKEYIFANKNFKCFNKELLIKSGDYFYKNKDEYSARRLYSKAFFLTNEQEQKSLLKKLDELNKKIIFSANIYPDSFTYTVVKGDNLSKIGKRFSITPELIKIINNLTSNLIYPGKNLKLIKTTEDKKFKIIAKKSTNKLYLLWGEDIARVYLISTGNPDISPTPEGTFKIVNKLIHPAWKGVPYGAPENILGTRWLGFNEPFNNYGIHGTTQPETIGQNVTNGCVRMLNNDVEELFDFITEDTEVVIEK